MAISLSPPPDAGQTQRTPLFGPSNVYDWPASRECQKKLVCVDDPAGPDTHALLSSSTAMRGSPTARMGSTIVGTPTRSPELDGAAEVGPTRPAALPSAAIVKRTTVIR